jgi:hypothetical protein
MTAQEDLGRVTFALNTGSGEIPALGFGTSLSDRTKTRDAVKAGPPSCGTTTIVPSG